MKAINMMNKATMYVCSMRFYMVLSDTKESVDLLLIREVLLF